jgi:hypothetical protein
VSCGEEWSLNSLPHGEVDHKEDKHNEGDEEVHVAGAVRRDHGAELLDGACEEI